VKEVDATLPTLRIIDYSQAISAGNKPQVSINDQV